MIQANHALTIAKRACDTLMTEFEAPMLPPAGRWHYHQGVFLLGMLFIWEQTKEQRYFDYVQTYVDSLVKEDGSLEFRETELDSIQAGVLLLRLYQVTQAAKYKTAADALLRFLLSWKQNAVSGYWHKENYPNQMWLDGIYMEGPFAVHYARLFARLELYDLIIEQFALMAKYIKDEQTGLLYHAWDESKQVAWADPVTGKSPEFWGRSMGWVVSALVDILDYLPVSHPQHGFLIDQLNMSLEAIVKFQDPQSGLWYQVLDKGDRPDNWLEHSCSCLFVYALAKALNQGYIDEKYRVNAEKGYDGITAMVQEAADGKLAIPEICIGTGVGNYQHYVERPRSTNDLHGVGAFLFACAEVAKF